MVMKSLWGKAAELTEKAKSYAGDYLKQDTSVLKDIETFKKETLTLLDEKVKENQAMQEMMKKNKAMISEQEGKIKTLTEEVKQLRQEREKEVKEKELLQKEKEEMNKRMNIEHRDSFKDSIQSNYNKIKVEIGDFDKEINSEIKRQLEAIKINNDNSNNTTINKTQNENKEESIIKKTEIKEEEELRIEPKTEESTAKEVEQKEEVIASVSEEKTDKKKRRKKKKKNQQTKTEPIQEPEQEAKKNGDQTLKTEETQSQTTQETITTTSIISNIQPIFEEIPQPQPINNIINFPMIDIDQLSAKLFSLLTPVIELHKQSFESYLSDNYKSLNDKSNEISQLSQSITSENITLNAKVSQLTEANSSIHSQLNSIQSEHNKLKEDHQNSLNTVDKITKEKLQAESDLNTLIEKNNNMTHTVNSLQNSITANQAEILKEKNKTQTIIQIFKQFFLMFLVDDIFIDPIESIFKEASSDSQIFIEKIYQLAKYIKPKIDYDYHKEMLGTNKDLFAKIHKYNLETNLIEIEKNYNKPIKSLDQLLSFNSSKSEFIISLINELVLYIENLSKTILNQSNKQSELSQSLKQIEDNKKAENDRLMSLQGEIKEKNSVISSFDKITKESKQLRADIESLNNKIINLINDKNTLTQEKQALNDKISLISQRCEVFKVENSELIQKVNESQKEVNMHKAKVASLSKDVIIINDIKSQLDKKDKMIKDYQAQYSSKEAEFKNLQNSYVELESFFENAKKEKEISIDNYKNQINELNKHLETLNVELKTAKANENSVKTANYDQIVKNNEALEAKIAGLEIENRNIKDQKEKIKSYSEEILKRVQNDFKESEFLIDKRMINSVLFKYFNPYTNNNIKHSLLETLANFMNYSNEERKQLGLAVKTITNEPNLTQSNNSHKDKLKELGEELYDFITNS